MAVMLDKGNLAVSQISFRYHTKHNLLQHLLKPT